MAGQGSLCRPSVFACRWWRVFGAICALWLLADLASLDASEYSSQELFSEVDTQVRLEWSSEQPRLWNFRVAIVDPDDDATPVGWIAELENHCSNVETTGAFSFPEKARKLQFQPRTKLSGGAAVLRIQAPRDAKLAIWSDSSDSPQTVPVAELLAGAAIDPHADSTSKPAAGVRWSLKRIGSDLLSIDLQGSSVFVSANSEFSFSVRGNSIAALASRTMVLRYQLYRVGHNKVVSEKTWPISIDEHGDSESRVVTEMSPPDPGVYEIRCFVEEDDENIWSRLRGKHSSLVRSGRPIIISPPEVNSAAASKNDDPPSWETVGEIQPSHKAAWSVSQWLPASANRLIPGAEPEDQLSDGKHAGEDVSLITPSGIFQATVPVLTPGLPHKITIRYPAKQSARMRVEVANVDSMNVPDVAFVLVGEELGDRSKKEWSSHTFVHYPRADDQIRLTNLNSDESLAFASIIVTAGPDHLSTAGTKSGDKRLAAMQLTDFDWIDTTARDMVARGGIDTCQPETLAMYRLWVATDRLRDYVISSGMNALVVPAVSNGRTWFDCQSFHSLRSRDSTDRSSLDLFLTLMGRSGLRVFLSVDTSAPLADIERQILQSPDLAEQLIHNARNTNVSPRERYNSLHPEVRNAIGRLIAEVDRQARGHSCYAGVILPVGSDSHLQADDEFTSDSTLALFAKVATAKPVPLVQIRRWIGQEGKNYFHKWRNSEHRRLYQTLINSVAGRSLLLQSQQSGDSMVTATINPELNLSVVRNVCRFPAGPLTKRYRAQQAMQGVDIPSGDSGCDVVTLCDAMPDGSSPVPTIRESTAADISRLVDRFDPSILLIQPLGMTCGLSLDLTETLTAYTSLTNQSIVESADPNSQVVQVRSSNVDGHLMLCISSQAPWPTQIELDCSDEVEWTWADGSDLAEHQDFEVNTDATRTSVTLPGQRLLVIKSRQPLPNGHVTSWTSHVSGGIESIRAIKRDVSAIVSRLGILSDVESYDVLSNAGFEQQGGVGLIGWLHAQHPPDSVRIDTGESVEGEHSVLLTTDARFTNRTWLVSETFLPPQSGRLAVSLATRGEVGTGDTPHRLRISIEGTRAGQPLRRSTELELPRNGLWQSHEVVLEVDGIEQVAGESLRLTIDSLASGRVWIDDVRLHDSFPLTKERGELQRQAFLAVQGLQRGNLTPSARLLQNHWARYLLSEGASRQPPPAVIDATETHIEPPGVAEKIRNWLPRPLRF